MVAGVSEGKQSKLAVLAAVQEELVRDGLFSYATDNLKGCHGCLDLAPVAAYANINIQCWINKEEKTIEDAKYWAKVAKDIAGV
ncbi:hypothetical protein PSHT_15165 [Puccinia striiformis]|uniref:Uncharacterized protein n=1 Tax=Puccinia striiformis TaxID=27350 RepID=A0A2S4UGM3_9BASI|nr:hypothetical protein PSHT_15165 [Puccinia striiformis]